MNQVLSYEELAKIIPFSSRKNADKLNEAIQKKLISLGIVPECNPHIPIFRKLAKITDPEFELNQYGYQCLICNIRLQPTEFVEFNAEKHSNQYRDIIR